MIILSPDVAAQIAAYAEKTYPEECVGLLLGQLAGKDSHKAGAQLFPVENRWDGQVALAEHDNPESRHDRFYLDPRDYLRADRAAQAQGLEIVGCYHSHPDHPALPSERDLVGAQGIGSGSAFSFLIQSVYQGKATDITSWLLVDEPPTATDSKAKRFVQEPLSIE
jgi:proteasome lid subunit RPN8/RPN11